MYKVDRETGQLQNCDDLPSNPQQTEAFLARFGNTFQGGNAHILHQLLQISSGSNLLYVGDHIFADVVRSKATTGWRTCLIVPELYSEIQVFKRLQPQREQLMQLKRQQHLIEREVDTLFAAKSKLLRSDASADVTEITSEWAAKSHELHLLHVQIRSKLATYDMEFHPRWGQLFKANFQESRISKQVPMTSLRPHAPTHLYQYTYVPVYLRSYKCTTSLPLILPLPPDPGLRLRVHQQSQQPGKRVPLQDAAAAERPYGARLLSGYDAKQKDRNVMQNKRNMVFPVHSA
jgi:hypothetical protein